MGERTVFQHLRARILARGDRAPNASLLELIESEWSRDFERYMRNRLIMGSLRYGRLHDNDRPCYDLIGSIIQRANSYLEDGNQEHLVDIANCALIEFVRRCCHPAPHFSPTDDDQSHHVEKL